MTGPEHYQKAEIALDAAAALQGDKLRYTVVEALLDAVAHATLAIAAATAFAADMTAGEWPGWLEAAGSDQTKADDEVRR